MWAAPGALWCLLHIWVQTDHVIGSWAGVTKNDLSTLLTDLTVVLMIRFIAITIFICYEKDVLYLAWTEQHTKCRLNGMSILQIISKSAKLAFRWAGLTKPVPSGHLIRCCQTDYDTDIEWVTGCCLGMLGPNKEHQKRNKKKKKHPHPSSSSSWASS